MPEFYRRARRMVMPTYFGPTNIPPLEANALGCPVAVSKVYGMPEQLVFRKTGLFRNEHCPMAERMARHGFYIPSGSALTDEQMGWVADSLASIMKR